MHTNMCMHKFLFANLSLWTNSLIHAYTHRCIDLRLRQPRRGIKLFEMAGTDKDLLVIGASVLKQMHKANMVIAIHIAQMTV